MKRLYLFVAIVLSASVSATTMRFAVLTDTHVNAPEIVYDSITVQDTLTQRDSLVLIPHETRGEALQALAICAEDIRQQRLDFILHAGDMTENGDAPALLHVRALLDSTYIPYYITSGNHETTWSRSALQDLKAVFDSTRFALDVDGLFFLGMNSGPILRMSDGHISPADTLWVRGWLDSLGTQPTFVITHYPLQNGDVDNWYDLTGILRQYNTQVVIGGHYHQNKHLTVDGIDNVLCRSSLPDKEGKTGYTIVEVDDKQIRFKERAISLHRDTTTAPATLRAAESSIDEWLTLPLARREYTAPDTSLLPSYAVNDSDSLFVQAWTRQLPVSFYASPVHMYGRIYIGDDNGTFYAFDQANGRILWRYKTTGRIVGSAAVKDGRVVFGSANGTLYCLSVENGQLLWRKKLGKPITGSVAIDEGTVYVGSSDSCFYAVKLLSGAPVWTYRGFGNYCIAKPLVYKKNVYVGAWDGYFYAFEKKKGKLLWRWNNGKTNSKLSPAAVWPCADDRRVYIAAPDRYLTALNTDSGTVSQRTNRWMVRESIGLQDSILFAKTMQDTIIAINLNADTLLWATDAGYGYEHAPTQLIAQDSTLFVTTKNGLVLALDSRTGEIRWRHKVGNSLLGTPCPITATEVVVSSSDGTVTYLMKREPILPDTTTAIVADSLLSDSIQQVPDSIYRVVFDSTGRAIDTIFYHSRDTVISTPYMPIPEEKEDSTSAPGLTNPVDFVM